MRKAIINVLFISLLAINYAVFATPAKISLSSPHSITPAAEIQRLANVIAIIHNYYIKPVDNSELFNSAIAGMLTKLDPHSAFLSEQDLKEIKITTTGKFQGVGITTITENGLLKVISPIDDSPAQKAGIKPGDIIYKVDNTIIKDMPTAKAIRLIQGKSGSKVTLSIIRKNEKKPLIFKLVRSNIKIQTVKKRLYEEHYGYLRIVVFHKPTKEALLQAIKELQKESHNQLYGIVLDLRNNPGGLLLSSIEVADLFLDANKLKKSRLIAYTKGYPNHKRENFRATAGDVLSNMPIVVLINTGSASAAEIVAGALQAHKRAAVIGTKSFGKGSVQTILPIDKKSALKLTTALYYTPDGKSIQTQGIVPDVMVTDLVIPKSKDEALLFDPINEAQLQNHIPNGDTQNKQSQSHTDKELMHKDYQLYEAINLLKGLSAVKK